MSFTVARRTPFASRRVGVVAFLTAALAAWKQRRDLARLDATARKDLGLTAVDIAQETARPLWDVPKNWRF